MEKLIRLLKILYAIQAKPGISAKELAERCETTDRTIYRDLEVLDSVAPIVRGEYGKGYRFDGNFAVYPLNFTEEEALVFSVLPSVVDKTQLPPGFESAYDKVIAAHRKNTRKRYETLENVADIIQMGRVQTFCCRSWKRSSNSGRSALSITHKREMKKMHARSIHTISYLETNGST